MKLKQDIHVDQLCNRLFICNRLIAKAILISGILIGIIGFSVQPVPAQNYRWQFVGEDNQDKQFYIDAVSYDKLSSQDVVRRIWVKVIYPDRSYRLEKYSHNCRSSTYARSDIATYNANGELSRNSSSENLKWFAIPPDSVAEKIQSLVCFTKDEDRKDLEGSQLTGKNNSSEIEADTFVKVIVNSANIRKSPSMKSEILVTVARGFSLRLIDNNSKNNWYRISLGELGVGWIHSNLIEFTN